ncbi:unnamed protein product [Prunus armeniaca]|uniref:Uncharacterized protein n=1 Tax=Prunus armeniaca TaxID=36596 RepID=A0A6J5TKV9_PRUAR|nr:unnamed protein product [Prunus armeniaca]
MNVQRTAGGEKERRRCCRKVGGRLKKRACKATRTGGEKEKRCCRRENTERNQGLQRGEEPRSKKVLQKLILKREETIPKVLQKISNNRKIKEETKGQEQSEKKGKVIPLRLKNIRCKV